MNDNWWKQFPVTVHFVEPVRITGTVTNLDDIETRDGIIPRVTLQTADGHKLHIHAGPVRLLAELVRLKPVIGDKVTIQYLGESSKKALGLSATKEFKVEVQRAEPRAGTRTQANPSGPENVSRPGRAS